MKILVLKIALLSMLTFSFSNLFSQTEPFKPQVGSDVIITMKNGAEFKGQVLELNDENIILKSENGEINLNVSNIRAIEVDNYEGKFAFENPHDTRYFFGPSGIPIEKGKGYYQNVLVTTNFVDYGLTKNISIGGGFEFISTIGFQQPIWFLTPKAGFELSEKVHVGGGFIMAGFAAEGTVSLAYGVFTYGISETNISIGAGYGFFDGTFSQSPAIMVAGTHRITNGLALLSENYFVSEIYFGMQGLRLISQKNSFDIGAILIQGASIPIPYVGYVRYFGKSK